MQFHSFEFTKAFNVLHQQIERQILTEKCETADEQQRAIDSARESAKALWMFLDGVGEAYLPSER